MDAHTDLVNELRAIVGEANVVTDPAEMLPWVTDWRERKTGTAVCVVFPATTEEVSRIVALAARCEQPIFPLGGNTGLCFGAVPVSGSGQRPGIVLSLRRMNRIRSLDRQSNVMIVDAGTILTDVHEAAADVGRQFPLHLGSEGSAQVGGLISTNAGGTAALRYGLMRDLVAGLEVVLPDGCVLNDLASLRKNNVSYALRELFIGAEGTLGIVTGAALHLHPANHVSAHAWLSVSSPSAAVELLARFQDEQGPSLEAFELVSHWPFAMVARHLTDIRLPFKDVPEWSVLIELGSPDPAIDLSDRMQKILAQGLSDGLVLDAAIATSERQANEIWRARHSTSEAENRAGVVAITSDVAVRVADVPAFIARAEHISREHFPMAEIGAICHLGDGNVHWDVIFDGDFWSGLTDPDGFELEIERSINAVVSELSGSFSAEHGIGRKLIEETVRLSDPACLDLMLKIKQAIDPKNLFNPGVKIRVEKTPNSGA